MYSFTRTTVPPPSPPKTSESFLAFVQSNEPDLVAMARVLAEATSHAEAMKQLGLNLATLQRQRERLNLLRLDYLRDRTK
jgi:hypothetical protein